MMLQNAECNMFDPTTADDEPSADIGDDVSPPGQPATKNIGSPITYTIDAILGLNRNQRVSLGSKIPNRQNLDMYIRGNSRNNSAADVALLGRQNHQGAHDTGRNFGFSQDCYNIFKYIYSLREELPIFLCKVFLIIAF